jgi:hypothetical protein
MRRALVRAGPLLLAARAAAGEAPGVEARLAAPATVSVGQRFFAVLSAAATGAPVMWDAGVPVLSGTARARPAAPSVSPPPGRLSRSGVVFTWTLTAESEGVLRIAVPVAATAFSGRRPVWGAGAVRVVVRVERPAALAAAWSPPPADWCAGVPFAATLAVSNPGGASAFLDAAPALVVEGEAGPVVLERPSPGAVTIPGGGTIVFTWTIAGARAGSVRLTATAAGRDANAGWIVPLAAAAPAGTLVEPGALSAVVAAPAEASRGQWVAVSVTLSNTGGSALRGLEAVLYGEGEGAFRRVPRLASRASLGPGERRELVWSWSVTGAGPLRFTVTARGEACHGRREASASASASLRAVPPAELHGSLAVSATLLVTGSDLVVALTVTNVGGAAADDLVAPVPFTTSGRISLKRGPARASLPRLAPGASTTFVWTFAAGALGPAGFGARATARDANAGWTVATAPAASPPLRLLSPASLRIERFSIFPEPMIRSGAFLTAALVLTNDGEAPAELTEVVVQEIEYDYDRAGRPRPNPNVLGRRSIFSPPVPTELPGRDSRSLVWNYQAGAWGRAFLQTTVKAKEWSTLRSIGALSATSNTVSVTGWIAP